MITTNKRWRLLKTLALCASAAAMFAGGSALAAGETTDRHSADSSKMDHLRTAVQGYTVQRGANGGITCGDSILDAGEQCDDGNSSPGDGCDSTCQVEAGFQCTLPVAPAFNAIADGGFEGGIPNGSWSEASTAFGTPLCDVASCGTGTGIGPDTGNFWAWFGRSPTGETSSINQTVVIDVTESDLDFRLQATACDSASDFLSLKIDGVEVFFINGADPVCGVPGYQSVNVDISAFSDGASHFISFESSTFAVNGGGSEFFVDNVVIESESLHPPVPSFCTVGVADTDGDGVTDDADNCTNDANPLQVDSNGDGIGNVCDADIAGVAGSGADDCNVDFFDLGAMKAAFFSTNADADLVGINNSEPDGVVNFLDLGRMKQMFFLAPGPSAAGCN